MNTSNQKIIISRDVLFDEHIHIDKNIDIQEDQQELINFNLFNNPTIPNNLPSFLPPNEQRDV